MEKEDLTNSPDFDWRAYVAHREPALLAMLFEEKTIESFEIRFCKPIDRNCNQHRCDFVAHRSDGTMKSRAMPCCASWQTQASTASATWRRVMWER